MITFALHGYENDIPAGGFGLLQAEFERRGFPCRIILSPKTPTKTPNQDRAKAMIEALRDVEGEIALVGISNQGLFMPLVAAARPIRRIVMLNAVMPFPGQSFLQGSKGQRVWTTWITRLLASRAPGMNEVIPLTALPRVEYVYICGEQDDAIRPEWEQWAAREYLHVEPVVIKGAGHGNIVVPPYASEVVTAATQGIAAPSAPTAAPDSAATSERQAWPGAATNAQTPRQRKRGNLLLSVPISGLAPLIAYFAIRPHIASDTAALAIAWLIPVIWTLISSLWRWRLDVFGLLGTIAYGVTLAISVVFGAGALPLKLHHALVGAIFGLVCLGSVAVDRPIFLLIPRLRTRGTDNAAMVDIALANPRIVRRITRLTLFIGAACLADAVLQTALAIALSTSAFLLATTAIHIGVIVVIAAVLLVSLWVHAGRAI